MNDFVFLLGVMSGCVLMLLLVGLFLGGLVHMLHKDEAEPFEHIGIEDITDK